MKPRHRKWFVFGPILFIGAVLLFGWIVKLLWNGVLVPATSVTVINFWQAVGLLVLSRILFGGFRGRGWGRNGGGRHWREKWMHMSDEERIKFREEWRRRCRPGYQDQSSEASSTKAE